MTKKEREIKITFTETKKSVDLTMIAAVVEKTMRKGGMQNGKRTKVL